MSIHTDRAIAKARELGGFAGSPEAAQIWDYSKRELVEIAIRLAEQIDPLKGIDRVITEHEILKDNGII